jgi:hypothetical protein
MEHSYNKLALKKRKPKKAIKVKAKRNDFEHEYQVEVIKWTRKHAGIFPGVEGIYSVPNGAHVSPQERGRLIREGMKKGVSDLELPVAKGGYFGLYIEMKCKGGTTSKDQIAFGEFVTNQGYLFKVCWSAEEAIADLIIYMNMKQTKGGETL